MLGVDIRDYGDHNPGATNVLRAGGRRVALLALFLDYAKATLPVGLAYLWAGFDGWHLAAIAVMPVAGHAFSPFLGFHGGKAVAATFGIWTGLTAWEGPSVLGFLLGIASYLLGANGWAVVAAMAGMMAYFWLTAGGWNGVLYRPPLPVLTLTWIGNMAILVYTHRHDLSKPPVLQAVKRQSP